jgi:glycosyltransferase involved in cell wall biosynthesis
MAGADCPTRLLMLSHYFEERRGGIEIVAAALARALTSRGFALMWLATGAAGGSDRDGYRRVALAASGAVERLLHVPYPLLRFSAVRRIFREAARCDIVLVHDALYLTSIVGYVAARTHRKPVVIVQHVGFVPFRGAAMRWLMKMANRCVATPLLRGAERVIFVSQTTMQYFARLRWRRSPALVFNGVDTDVFSPASGREQVESARRELGLPVDARVALFVGRFVEKKGLAALESIARLRADLMFAFAGSGALDPRVWGLPNVRVYSALSGSTLVPLYRASDVLLLPSVGEGFPLVVQEALACGLRIICGTEAARADARAAEFINGVEVDPTDPRRTARVFSEEITRLLALPEPQGNRIKRFEFARASYSLSTSAGSYVSILQGLCQVAGAQGRSP